MRPETQYAKSSDLHIAYQVVGEGSLDLVFVPSWVSNVEYWWNHAMPARYFRRLSDFARVILFDGRGIGLSDATSRAPTLEERVDDVLAVMDAAGSDRAALCGLADAAAVAALAAATFPQRFQALVLNAGFASSHWHPDYPWGPHAEERRAQIEQIVAAWGSAGPAADRTIAMLAPSAAGDQRFREWWVSMARQSASPGRLRQVLEMNVEMDVRSILSSIKVPTLILHRRHDKAVPVENGRYLQERIPAARLVVLDGSDHLPFVGDIDSLIGEMEEFLTGTRGLVGAERVLATILFTDIVGSTRLAAELGDRRWRHVLDDHDEMVRHHLARFRGKEVKSTGDGFVATFDGPARAIHCSREIAVDAAALGIEIRAGIHTGECEIRDDDIGGIAVHVAARILAEAAPGEVIVSSTVKELVIGSGIRFADRETRVLRGVPDEWHLFAVAFEDRPPT